MTRQFETCVQTSRNADIEWQEVVARLRGQPKGEIIIDFEGYGFTELCVRLSRCSCIDNKLGSS